MSRAPRDSSDKFSLFPFLAVLLCTMGALLVLLIGLTKAGRDRVAQRQEAERLASLATNEPQEKTANQLAQVTQYTAQLEAVRSTAIERLRENKSRLSHLEDHMRRLKDELGTLQIAAMELEATSNEHLDDRAQAEAELQRVRQMADEIEERVAKLEEEQRGKGKSYAIVPYEGRNGTYRPTIYIECRKDKVILQPEGVELKSSDFEQPLGAGNPLAAALRAAREHLLRTMPMSIDKTGEPYPLILVRPDGIGAYYRVREAIRGWEADFGYELVDGDWNLTYPAANPELARIEYRAIQEARARRELLAEAAPKAYGNMGNSFEIEADATEEAEGSYGSFAGTRGAGEGSGSNGAPGISSNGSGREGATDSGSGYGVHGGLANGGQPGLSEIAAVQESSSGTMTGPALALGGASPNETGTSGFGGAGEQVQLPSEVASTNDAAGDSSESLTGPSAQGTVAQQSGGSPGANPGMSGTGNQATSANGAMAQASTTGGSTASPPNMQSAAGTPQAASRMSASGTPSESNGASANFDASAKPSRTHGKDWAIRNPIPANVAIRRTVQVAVRPDQVAILPDQAQIPRVGNVTGEKMVPLETGRAIPVDIFVAGLWQHMDQWGMAGNGLYWKPVLVVHVAPGGEQRAAELAQLLRNSGVEVRSSDTAQRTDQPGHATPR